MQHRTTITEHFALSILLSGILAGCQGSQAQAPSIDPTPLARHSCIGDAEAPRLLTGDMTEPVPILAGGSLRTGEFVIGIWLYCDPTLDSTDYFSPNFSEISHLGFRYEWMYLGLPVEGETETIISINGVEASRDGVGPGLNTGSAGALTGPLKTERRVIAEAASLGKPVEYLITVEAPHVTEAAVLYVRFTLAEEGYYVSEARLRPLGK